MTTETLDAIRSFASKEHRQSKDRQHDFNHVERVVENALRIADVLKVGGRINTNLLQAACYLHDVVIARRNSENFFRQLYNFLSEKQLNKKHIGKILERFDLSPEEGRTLAVSIINHPHSILHHILERQKDLYSKLLQDADTLDYISPMREHSFIIGKGKMPTYLTNRYLSWIRKNIGKYLNFPELAEKMNANVL